MMPPEEVLRSVEYVRCPDCFGTRKALGRAPGLPEQPCSGCQGWGCVASPAEPEERIELGLKALHPSVIIELAPAKRRLRIRLRRPLRKKAP